MVDRFSASASEILAGALQDYHRAVIVGTGATHGKGTVQQLINLDRIGGGMGLGVLKLTIEQFFRPDGASTQIKGVTPDILLPDPAGYVKSREKTLDHAIAWSSIPAAPHDDWKVTYSLPDLVKRSASRVSKDAILNKVERTTELLRARRDDTRVPLERAAWEARQKAQKAELDAVSPDLDKAPKQFTVSLLADPTVPKLAPRPGGKEDDRPKRMADGLARDPWLGEAVHVLADMKH